MPLERGLDDSALDTSTAAVNQPHLAQACRCRRGDVLLDYRSNIRGCERVEIDFRFDRDLDRFTGHLFSMAPGPTPGASYR